MSRSQAAAACCTFLRAVLQNQKEWPGAIPFESEAHTALSGLSLKFGGAAPVEIVAGDMCGGANAGQTAFRLSKRVFIIA